MADFSGMERGIVDLAKHMQANFPQLVLTSGYRSGEGSYHGWGQAADLSWTAEVMFAASKYVVDSGIWRQLVEGIHNPNLSVKNKQQVSTDFWGWDTWSAHENHIHLAIVGDFFPPKPPQPTEEPDWPTMVVLHERD